MDCFVAEPVIGRAFARPVGPRNGGQAESKEATRLGGLLPV